MLEVDALRSLGDFTVEARFTSNTGITALFGRSGAGKSSVINMVSGLLKPDRGRIAVDDRILFDSALGIDLPPWQRKVGYVFQAGHLFPHLTVRRNLCYGRWFTPVSHRYLEFDRVLRLLDLEHLLDRRPHSLSGGEKQRVAIGRALLTSPKLLLMDEPLASLDVLMKNEILPYIERLNDMGIPILYVSHSLEELARLANTLVLLANGQVTACGRVEEILSRMDLWTPEDESETGSVLSTRVAGHDRESQLTHLTLQGGELHVPFVDIPVGFVVRVWIRARDVILATEAPRGLSVRNVLAGTIVEIGIGEGPVAELKLRIGKSALLALVTRQAVRDLALAPGKNIYALIKSVNLDNRQIGLVAAMANDSEA